MDTGQVSRSSTPDAVGLVEGLHLVSQLVELVLAHTLVLILARCQKVTDCQLLVSTSELTFPVLARQLVEEDSR